MTIDVTQPVETEDGCPVRLICTDRKGGYSLIGLILTPPFGVEEVSIWNADGEPWTSSLPLRNVPVKEKVDPISLYCELSAAQGASQELNLKVANLFEVPVEDFTGSVDASLALMSRAFPGIGAILQVGEFDKRPCIPGCQLYETQDSTDYEEGATLPLAILKALVSFWGRERK